MPGSETSAASPPTRQAAPASTRSTQQLLAAFGALALTNGLAVSNGLYDLRALLQFTLAAGLALWAAALGSPWRRARPGDFRVGVPASAARMVLAASLADGLFAHLFHRPGKHLSPPHPLAFVLVAVLATALAASYLARARPRLARARFPLLVACFAAMATIVIAVSPRPPIDVWVVLQGGADGLLHGQNPYAIDYPNVYGDARYTTPAFLRGDRFTAYPYPPLTALLSLPFQALLGDVRYLLLAAMLLAAWALRRLSGGPVAEMAALALLFQPRSFFVLEMSWTEPTVMAAWALALLATLRWRSGATHGWVLGGAAAALLAASKQYSPILLLPLALALPPRRLGRAALLALAVLASVTLPFVLWDPREFYRDVILLQVLQPFRPDAVSWLAALARLAPGRKIPVAPAFLLAGLVLGGTLGRRVPLAQAAAAAPAGFLALLLFSKQAFCNYYWLAGGLLLAACALFEAQGESDVAPGTGGVE